MEPYSIPPIPPCPSGPINVIHILEYPNRVPAPHAYPEGFLPIEAFLSGYAAPASLTFHSTIPNNLVLYDLTYTDCHNGQLQSPMLTLIVLAPAWIAAFDYM